MTLEEVAKLCGTTKQTIYKYENEIVTKIPYDKIELLANALGTTPSYLFGWEQKNSTDKMVLTDGEKKILELFRRIPEDKQDMVIEMIQAALNSQK